jgi:hypothetical protein
MIERVRTFLAGPHDLLHAVQFENKETSQLTGHMCVLHNFCSERATGHAVPLHTGVCVMWRVRECCPPVPQSKVHVPHVPHADTRQSTSLVA